MILRPAQLAMLSGMKNRHQLVAGMGTGKSGAMLCRASEIEFTTGAWPGMMIVAPLQVCINWVSEIPKWMLHARVALVAGTAKQRAAACQQLADIYLISYDSLPWLETYKPTGWGDFGAMCVADESTRLRGTRVSWQKSKTGTLYLMKKGGATTNALAAHAADFKYWVNATGTPCPNGLQNWWPQMWYIDGGRRLGKSYTAFEERWFYTPPGRGEFASKIPVPGAAEDIMERIRDVVTVVRTEDFFDVAEPNVVDIPVVLPLKARAVYRDMKNKMTATLPSGDSVVALSAASKVSKLAQIAAGWVYWADALGDPDIRNVEALHTAKCATVDSILTETDENLVVFYQFQATVDMLKQHFKSAVTVLGESPTAQEDWNAGKIKILACQYQRGGMGLSLQHGGRNVCFIEPTYWADSYEQAIERLGPLRQMQSGYNRTVNVFRVVTEDSVDAHIYEAVAKKIDLQDAAVAILAT